MCFYDRTKSRILISFSVGAVCSRPHPSSLTPNGNATIVVETLLQTGPPSNTCTGNATINIPQNIWRAAIDAALKMQIEEQRFPLLITDVGNFSPSRNVFRKRHKQNQPGDYSVLFRFPLNLKTLTSSERQLELTPNSEPMQTTPTYTYH